MKILNFKQNKLKFLLLTILAVLFLFLNYVGFFTSLEDIVYDFTLFIRHWWFEPMMEDVVLLSIDDATINELGPWPIDRSYYADIIKKLESAGVSAIGLDIILSTPSSDINDKKLITVLKSYNNIVLPVVADFRRQSNNLDRQNRLSNFSFEKPYKHFAENTVQGHINYLPDGDGIIRKLIPLIGDKQHRYKSFAVELVETAGFKISQVDLFDLNRELLISFSGPSSTIPTLSFLDIIKGEFDSNFLRGKVVIIGVNSVGMGDRYMNPFSRYGYVTGSQIHTQTIVSILNGNLKKKAPYLLNTLIYLIAAIASIHLFFRYNPFKATLILITYFILYTIIYLTLFGNNIIITYVTQFFLVLGIYIISIFNWYFSVNNEKVEIIGAFEHYLSPGVMQKLLKNPSGVTLGGEETYLTVIFVDIRDFTLYAENRSPKEVVDVLNNAFEQITSIIFRNEGTLDKFLGDGFMAFFGAPLEMKDHEKRAVDTALEIQEIELPFKLGIGINSGHVIAGNVGSSNRLEYTVIGDVVNKAARFVDIAKPGEIIIGLDTYFVLKDQIKWQKDFINIKGSSKEIEVYRF